MSVRHSILACTLLLPLTAAYAVDMLITPGNWQIQVSSKMSLLPEPTVKNMQQCFTADRVSPEQIMRNSGNCQFTDVASSRDRLSWKVSCNGHGGNMSGTGQFNSHGDSMNGSMQMSMEMHGQQITMHHQWSGKRIGPCN